MNSQQFDALARWFWAFAQSHYADDAFINNNLRLKECHTRRVCGLMRQLTASLGVSADDAVLAEAVALLHDVARFPQFARYRTYKDAKSVNHCQLGVEIIDQHRLLDGLPTDQIEIIRFAVLYHGAKDIPPTDPRRRFFTQLIRDVDKLDIYCLCVENYRRYYQDKQAFPFEVEFHDAPHISPQVVEAICRHQTVDYRWLKTLADAQLLQLGWVFDTNFDWTLRQMHQRGYIDGIARWLPEIPEAQKALRAIRDYVQTRLDGQSNR